jgi:ergothioneine biosynthesis protein EgtB
MATYCAPHSRVIGPEALRRQFLEVRSLSLRITAGLSPEDQMLQSMPDASPTKWHLAHTTWFFETFLLEPLLADYRLFDARYTYLFNSYYKQLGAHPNRGARGLLSRPSLAEVHAYRSHVDCAMLEAIERLDEAGLQLCEMGLHHEQQHQELIMTDIKHALWSTPLARSLAPSPAGPARSAPPLSWIEFDGGICQIGHSGPGFAFDNETPRHDVLVPSFRLASRAVTNAEYMEFMSDQAYRRPELWLSDGWDQICAQTWAAPLYWERRDDQWWQFATDGLRPVDPNEPVCHLSFYEADAYARWSGARLPGEAEWEIAAREKPAKGTLLEDNLFHPQAAAGEGLQQTFGDVWEWTASPYLAYPGFQQAAGAVGEYNGKFMCNQFVLRGGSCVTPSSHIRATYRNFFPPHVRWQFSGLRLAE